jgi:hypothetical protein
MTRKGRIRDKHSGSATLEKSLVIFSTGTVFTGYVYIKFISVGTFAASTYNSTVAGS